MLVPTGRQSYMERGNQWTLRSRIQESMRDWMRYTSQRGIAGTSLIGQRIGLLFRALGFSKSRGSQTAQCGNWRHASVLEVSIRLKELTTVRPLLLSTRPPSGSSWRSLFCWFSRRNKLMTLPRSFRRTSTPMFSSRCREALLNQVKC
jgi:hypothetical protein